MKWAYADFLYVDTPLFRKSGALEHNFFVDRKYDAILTEKDSKAGHSKAIF